MIKKGMGLFITILGIMIFWNFFTMGKIIFVDDDFTNDPANHKWNSIQLAINDANDGDIIYVFNGTYKENITINKEVRIIGENVFLDGNGSRVVDIKANNVYIENFIISNGKEGIYFGGNNITIKNCSINNCSISLLTNFQNISIDNCSLYSTEYAALINGSNISLKNCSLSAKKILKIAGNNITIKNCSIFDGDWGILINRSFNVAIDGCKIHSIENKSIWANSSSNIFVTNTSINISFCGILFTNISNSTISYSIMEGNKEGIKLINCSYNEIINCNFINNFGYAIYLDNSFNNTIHHNNFIGNDVYDNGINKWNTSIGNYWDDYTGIDLNGDGIGDSPHKNDHRPLLYPIQTPPLFVWVDDDFNSSIPGWQIDHFNNIQQALEKVANKGHIFIYKGNYNPIQINKEIEIIGENPFIEKIEVKADNVSLRNLYISGVQLLNIKNFTIKNCNLYEGGIGLYAVNSIHAKILNCTIYNNTKGIYLFNSSEFLISNVSIYNNRYFGIEICYNSSQNEIINSNIWNNGVYGIYILQNSTGNRIFHNNFLNNTAYDECNNEWSSYEMALGNYWDDYTGTDLNGDGIGDIPYEIDGGAIDYCPLVNIITTPPYFVWVSPIFNSTKFADHFSSISDAINEVREGGGCFVFAGVYKENVEINKRIRITGKNATVEGGDGSAFVLLVDGIVIEHFIIRNCWDEAGITIYRENATIAFCDLYNNYYGIYLKANNVSIKNCKVYGNSFAGIFLENCMKINISGCDIYCNNEGIMAEHSSYGRIENNVISNNSINGLKFVFSHFNDIINNDFLDNIYGIYLDTCVGNTIYFNNFIRNRINAYDNGINKWNTSIGNYWDDYTGTDENIDGIGDTPYEIDNDSIDYFPLVKKAGIPIANFNFTPLRPYSLETVQFIDLSIDYDGFIVNYTWNFGDGRIAYGSVVTHSYSDDGIYNITLTITDDDGNKSNITKSIIVRNIPPIANFTYSPQKPTDLDIISFNSTSYDPDGFIVNYTWNFGDGRIAYGRNVTHSYSDDGIYNITLTITDDDGARSKKVKKIEVKNVKPKAIFTYSPEKPRQGEEITFDASQSFDADGNIISYEWDFESDGVIDDYGKVVIHKYNKKGAYTVTLLVKDDDNTTDSFEMVINVKEKERIPGFELIIIVIASAILIFMRKYKKGIWRI